MSTVIIFGISFKTYPTKMPKAKQQKTTFMEAKRLKTKKLKARRLKVKMLKTKSQKKRWGSWRFPLQN